MSFKSAEKTAVENGGTVTHVQIVTTAERKEDADRLATILVTARLVACAQVSGPITSRYWWDGKIQETTEWYCVAKTRASLFGKVAAAIRENHPYTVPEIVAMPIVAGHGPYLDWIDETTAGV